MTMAVCNENKHWWRTPVEVESVSLQPWHDPVLLKHWGMSLFFVFFIWMSIPPQPTFTHDKAVIVDLCMGVMVGKGEAVLQGGQWDWERWSGGGGSKGGKGTLFSGSYEEKFVHSLLDLPHPSLPPVSLLLWGRLDENVMFKSSALSPKDSGFFSSPCNASSA